MHDLGSGGVLGCRIGTLEMVDLRGPEELLTSGAVEFVDLRGSLNC